MARNAASTQDKVLKLHKEGKTPIQIATKVKTSRNNVYMHLRKLREAGLLEEPTSAKANGNGHAKRNSRSRKEKPDPVVEAAILAEAKASVALDGETQAMPTSTETVNSIIERIRGEANEGANLARQRMAEIDADVAHLQNKIIALGQERSALEDSASELEAITTV